MSRPASLRARLLAGVLCAVSIAWVGVSVTGYLRSRHEMEDLFDAHLAQSAALLIAQISESGEEGEEDDDEGRELELEHAPELHRYARNVAFQVWERGRKLRAHSRNAPRKKLSAKEEGFSDASVDGVRWRVFSTWALERRALVQMAERADARDAVSAQIARHLLAPLLVALPLLGVGLLLAIGRALAPLRALADAVAARDPQRLEPVAADRVPGEVRALVERLNELFARIEVSLERERTFTADAAHELRTPLAAIRAQAQVARGSRDDAERAHALGQVIAGCDRAARLSGQLLTPVAREVLAEVAQTAHSRGVAVELHAEAPVTVRGDASLLHVLLRNLVDNAIRYGAGGSAVRVELGRDASHAVLRVVDQGPGIPAAERARVRDRFYRGLGTGESGAGLGLAIASRIAALHGAALELDEGPGARGLSVTLRWPIPGAAA
ncbi:MAG: integral rane sensor signal transduction histidine kinase [Deltaproteobacteria bacterium]|nr:integral rane sensor signal transduction histidine kinase [Deltaproteobacteria bacterium]